MYTKYIGYNLKVSHLRHDLLLNYKSLHVYDLCLFRISHVFNGSLFSAIKLKENKLFTRPPYYNSIFLQRIVFRKGAYVLQLLLYYTILRPGRLCCPKYKRLRFRHVFIDYFRKVKDTALEWVPVA
jgi:hypothetical protein